MRAVVVGAGPVGLLAAGALAEQGHDVVLVDPDVGPSPDGSWRRRGVMQFMHPHFFRHQVRTTLQRHVPAMWDAVIAAGGIVTEAPEGAPPDLTSLACRRSTFERALRDVAGKHPRITFMQAHAERVIVEGDRVTGIEIGGGAGDGSELAADVVLVATGRTSRFADDLRPPGEGRACGQSYVARMYRARPGVEPLLSNLPVGKQFDGYQAIAFPQDAGTLSALVVRGSADAELSMLWQAPCFEAAVEMIPNLAPWTDQERFEPITDVMRGGTLTNSYRGQGTLPAGIYFIGDAVCTTNPSAGRGVTLGFMQVSALLDAVAEHGNSKDASAAFDDWCLENVKPWYEDHVVWDASVVRRYAGEDLDIEGPLPSDVISAAGEVDPSLMSILGPYFGMLTHPRTLDAAADRVRALLRSGWRPALAEGPDRKALLERLAPLSTVS